jgi:hypothetical protein
LQGIPAEKKFNKETELFASDLQANSLRNCNIPPMEIKSSAKRGAVWNLVEKNSDG